MIKLEIIILSEDEIKRKCEEKRVPKSIKKIKAKLGECGCNTDVAEMLTKIEHSVVKIKAVKM